MVKQETTPLVGVLLGYAPTPEKALEIAETHRKCPYCVSYRSAGRSVTGVFVVPHEHRWWLQWVADAPQEALGLESATLFFPQAVEASSPWARGAVSPSMDQAPCEIDCSECSWYKKDCQGCPATRYYLSDRHLSDCHLNDRQPNENQGHGSPGRF
jgi:hypothetical protein